MPRPLIGITPDLVDGVCRVASSYADAVTAAGGRPIVLPCAVEHAAAYTRLCAGVVLSGGDDPIMERWGVATHPKARPVDERRQAFELALLQAMDEIPERPVMGVCLGMQLMGLHAGGTLDQHLPDALPTAETHWGQREHAIDGPLGAGVVHSHHRQALTDPGALTVVATAPDDVIEAVRDDRRPFYVGVQWHPERTADEALGLDLFRAMVECAAGVAV